MVGTIYPARWSRSLLLEVRKTSTKETFCFVVQSPGYTTIVSKKYSLKVEKVVFCSSKVATGQTP